MSNNQNQGASIEAAAQICDRLEAMMVQGGGETRPGERLAQAARMIRELDARRTPAAQVGAGELPPLPEPRWKAGDFEPWAKVWTDTEVRAAQGAAIEADRAQLASLKAAFDAAVSLAGETIEARNAEIADLRAQLAAKGQDDTMQQVRDLLEGATAWSPGKEAKQKIHAALDLLNSIAAPASTQPADPRLEVFIDWYLREGKRSEIHPNGHAERTTRSHVLAWLDSRAGAQPDQRESAAETVPISPMFLASAAFCIENHGSVKPETRQQMIDKLLDLSERMQNAKQTTAVASPAAQPAKDEQTEACRACNGSGWVVRDHGIGTDQECFVCNGTGQDSANNGADEQKGGAA